LGNSGRNRVRGRASFSSYHSVIVGDVFLSEVAFSIIGPGKQQAMPTLDHWPGTHSARGDSDRK